VTELDTIYRRLGGEAVFDQLVERLYANVLKDPALAPFFRDTDMPALKSHQRTFLIQALGGPSNYTGRDIREAHHGRHIREAHFYGLMDHIVTSLYSLKIDEDLIGEVIDRLEGMSPEIIEKP